MFATVIPALRLPRRLTTFTYTVPDALQSLCRPGVVISVPWRNRAVDAVVVSCSNNAPADITPERLKNILAVRHSEPLLTEQQRQLIDRLANTYCVAPGTVLKMLLPSIPKRTQQLKPRTQHWAAWQAVPGSKLTTPKSGVHLAWYRSWQQRANVLSRLIDTVTDGQVLIIVPERSDIELAGAFISEPWRNSAVILGNETAKNRQWDAWQNIRAGTARLVIGTRSALFAPFSNLKLIIIDDEADDSLKQWDQNPRYDARRVAEWLANDWRCPLVFASPAPRPETYAATVPDRTICLPEPRRQTINVIDLRPYRRSHAPSLLSEPLRQAILEAHDTNQKSALFLNRRGLGSSVSCRDCGTVFTCAACQLPLTPHRGGMLDCHHCGSRQPLPVGCPKCNGTQFFFAGQGSELLEQELQTLWPGAHVLRLDADNHPKKLTAKQVAAADIYVGTELMTGYLPMSEIGATGIVYCDNLFSLPNWRAAERSWRYLSRVAAATAGSLAGTLFLQTFRPDSVVITHFAADTATEWYTHELNARRDFNYPPFGQLTALIAQSPTIAAGQATAARLYDQLTAKAKQDTIDCIIQAPQLIHGQQIRGRYRVVMSIKHQCSIAPLLAVVPDDWLIDTDPLDIM